MTQPHLELHGWERVRYFGPTFFCGYLTVLCLALIAVAHFLAHRQDIVATTAAGVFGFCLSGALGTFFWHVQRSELRYLRVCTSVSASINFNAVRAAAAAADWQIMAEHAPDRLQARTAGTLLTVGERVDVLCCGGDVLIACICDPSVGFSLAGRRRCARHRDHIRSAVNSASFPNVGSSGTDHWDTAQ